MTTSTLRDGGLTNLRSQILWQRSYYNIPCVTEVCRNNGLRYCGDATTKYTLRNRRFVGTTLSFRRTHLGRKQKLEEVRSSTQPGTDW
ncbi:hypothetical protein J6590_000323 [Homalodisca vitripennis]|nr:hypothetical protein J6590_000323 [Homalodisca vitripennis]